MKNNKTRNSADFNQESKGDESRIPSILPEDSVLGFSDELVFSEFVEALATLALMTMQTARYVHSEQLLSINNYYHFRFDSI